MGNLRDVIADATVTGGRFSPPPGGKKQPKGKYIALALVPKGTFPAFGASYTPAQGSPTTLTGFNFVSLLAPLVFGGTAWFLGNGLINGKRGKPSEMTGSALYGTETIARPTGEVAEKVDFEVKYFYYNREFFNALRYNFNEWDIYLFTDRSVELVSFTDCSPVFSGIGDETPGDINKDIAGSFSLSYSNDGQIIPVFGIDENTLKAELFRFAFGTITVASGITRVVGTDNYNMTSGTGGTIARTVSTSGASGITYSVFLTTGADVPAAVTINSGNGTVTVANGLTAGVYNMVVMAQNTTGVVGQYPINLTVA